MLFYYQKMLDIGNDTEIESMRASTIDDNEIHWFFRKWFI